ncbi:hypothetical protein [Gordonibacter pamelaeae]|mgnify:CR=1 FL=1|uniref:hypothetical protein n=1 Tax=Gordonibacter pamelaeae TaxID=471189 RepID=UPI00242C42DC|nr:hypothetical protein [Gordonibacter pamelaeae]
MSNEVLPFISNEVVELFEEFDDDYLADVLRPWDCDAQDWLDHTTTVFRFENDDLLVWNEMGGLKAMRGIVDTQSFDASLLAPGTKDACLVWRVDAAFGDLVGTIELSATLLELFV